jgi:hypothetical protein
VLLGLTVIDAELTGFDGGHVETDDSVPRVPSKEGVIALAGIVAVELVFGPVVPSPADDMYDCDEPTARRYAQEIAGPEGDVDRQLDKWREEAFKLLDSRQQLVKEFATELRRTTKMTGPEIHRFVLEAEERSQG